MAQYTTMEWQGATDLNRKLNDLARLIGDRGAQNVLTAAARKALAPMKKRAIQNAPYDPSPDGVHIKENIIIRKSKASREDQLIMQLTIRWKDRAYKDNKHNRRKKRVGKNWRDEGFLFYAKFQEFGLPSRNIPPNAYMRRAFHECKDGVQPIFADALGNYIVKYAEKYA